MYRSNCDSRRETRYSHGMQAPTRHILGEVTTSAGVAPGLRLGELGASGRRSAGARRPRRRWQGAGVRRRRHLRDHCGAPRQNQKSCLWIWRTAFPPPHRVTHFRASFRTQYGALGTHLTPLSLCHDARAQPRAQAVVCVVLLHPIETTSHTSIAPLSSQPTLLPCSCNPPQREPRRPASHAAFASIWFTITSHRTPIGNALHPV